MSAGSGDRKATASLPPSVDELESRLAQAEGDPKRVAKLLNSLALSVIEEVREQAASRALDKRATDSATDSEE